MRRIAPRPARLPPPRWPEEPPPLLCGRETRSSPSFVLPLWPFSAALTLTAVPTHCGVLARWSPGRVIRTTLLTPHSGGVVASPSSASNHPATRDALSVRARSFLAARGGTCLSARPFARRRPPLRVPRTGPLRCGAASAGTRLRRLRPLALRGLQPLGLQL